MKKFFKWTGIILLTIIVVAAIISWFLANKYDRMAEVTFEVADSHLLIPNDSAAVVRGKYWAETMCSQCHGNDFAGTAFLDDPNMGTMNALNLTKGKGGIGNVYSDEDWIRAIRHGVRKGNHGIMTMPAKSFTNMSDYDLGCLVAFIKTIPPVDKQWSPKHFTYLTRVIAGAGGFGILYDAEVIDHKTLTGKVAPIEAASIEYGDYLVRVVGCRNCHGEKLNGAISPDPESPFCPNISKGGHLGKWTDEQFVNTFRNGVTPEGKALQAKFMPWLGIGKLSDDALKAIYLYIQSQPSLPETEH